MGFEIPLKILKNVLFVSTKYEGKMKISVKPNISPLEIEIDNKIASACLNSAATRCCHIENKFRTYVSSKCYYLLRSDIQPNLTELIAEFKNPNTAQKKGNVYSQIIDRIRQHR
jgi:hypothetical protein